MAVIEGITASVIVDGEPLEEFNEGDDDHEIADDDSDSDYASSSDDDDQKYVDDKKALQDLVTTSRRRYFGPNRQVTKYIPSVSGAEFVVKVSLSPNRIRRLKSEALVMRLFIDGNLFKSTIWMKKDDEDGLTFKNLVVATPAGPFQKPFLFSEIVTRNDDSDTADADDQEINIDKIGTILVQVFRLMVSKRSRPRSKTAKNAKTTNTFIGDKFEGLRAVSEKKFKGKALSHFADLGPGKPYYPSSNGGSWSDSWKTHYVDGDIPISTFEFKYCSRKALKDMLIIPRSPPPPSPPPAARIPSPVRQEPLERPLDELSHEELLELARAQKAQLSIKTEVKPSIIKEGVQAWIKNEAQESILKPKTGIKRDRDDDADEDDFQITVSRSVRFKPAATQSETIKLDSDTEEEVSRPVTKSKPAVSFKPPNSAAETITTIKPHGDVDQPTATNSKSNNQTEGKLNIIRSEGDAESRQLSDKSKPTISLQPPGSAEVIDL